MNAVLGGSLYRGERLLPGAIAISLALHFGLLYFLPLFEQVKWAIPAPKVLTAQLVAPKPPEPPRITEEPAVAPSARAPKAVRPAPQRPAVRAIEPEAAPVVAVSPSPTSPPAAAVTAPEPPAAAAAPPRAASQAASGPDPGSLAVFRQELILVAGRHKRYPRVAVDNNWEGKVDLRMLIGANGQIASLSVRKSAGYAPLDDEAQRMFRTAKGQLVIPPALRGREFTIDISADFYFLKE